MSSSAVPTCGRYHFLFYATKGSVPSTSGTKQGAPGAISGHVSTSLDWLASLVPFTLNLSPLTSCLFGWGRHLPVLDSADRTTISYCVLYVVIYQKIALRKAMPVGKREGSTA